MDHFPKDRGDFCPKISETTKKDISSFVVGKWLNASFKGDLWFALAPRFFASWKQGPQRDLSPPWPPKWDHLRAETYGLRNRLNGPWRVIHDMTWSQEIRRFFWWFFSSNWIEETIKNTCLLNIFWSYMVQGSMIFVQQASMRIQSKSDECLGHVWSLGTFDWVL